MALTTTTNKIIYSGDGTTTTFSYNFYVLKDTDLIITQYDTGNNATTLTLNLDYTITGVGNESGGSVTLNTTPPSGYTLLLYREVEYTQESTFTEGEAFPIKTIENDLDKLTMEVQQLSEKNSRALSYDHIDTDSNVTLPASVENRWLGTDDSKNLEWKSITTQSNKIVTQSTAPTVNDDVDAGYAVGDKIIDTTTYISYECMDNTAGAAVWHSSEHVAENLSYSFFLTPDAADVSGYYYGYDYDKGGSATSLTSPTLTTGDDQLLWSFVSESGKPALTLLSAGIYASALYLSKSGGKDVTIHRELWKRATDGTETLLLSSQASDPLSDALTQYYYSTSRLDDINIDVTDRLVYKLLANVSGTGTDVTVTLDMEGNYDSRISIAVTSNSFANVFLAKSVYDTDDSGVVDNAELIRSKVPDISVAIIPDLMVIDTNLFQSASLQGYHSQGDGGGGTFYWDAAQFKANHNGGTIIDPTDTFPTDWTDQTQLDAWFPREWKTDFVWVIGDSLIPTTTNNCRYTNIVAGTSGANEPTWDTTDGNTTVDNNSPAWATATNKLSGAMILATTDNGYNYECTTAGITGATEPTWPTTIGNTITDNAGIPAWVASTTYNLGDIIVPTTTNGYTYECTTAGTSDSAEPTWGTTVDGTTADGTVVWTCRAQAVWTCRAQPQWETINQNGCWMRVYDDYVMPEWFGAKGDGTTDDTKAMQEAINNTGKVTLLNSYFLNSIEISNNVHIKMENSLIKFSNSSTQSLFYDTSAVDSIYIESNNASIDMQGDSFSSSDTDYTDIYCMYFKYATDIHIDGLTIENSPDGSIFIGDYANIVTLIDYTKDSIIKNVSILSTGTISSGVQTSAKGIKLSNVNNFKIENCYIENVPTNCQGIQTVNCSNIIIDKCRTYNCSQGNSGGGGIWLSYGTSNSTVKNCVVDYCGLGITPIPASNRLGNYACSNEIIENTITNSNTAVLISGFFNDNVYIKNNIINGASSSGIAIYPTEDVSSAVNGSIFIENNDIINNTIYFSENSVTADMNYDKIVIKNNYLYSDINRCIKFDPLSKKRANKLSIVNNIIYESSTNAIDIYDIPTIEIINNKFFNVPSDKQIYTVNDPTITSTLYAYNNYANDTYNKTNVVFPTYYSLNEEICELGGMYNVSASGDGTTKEFVLYLPLGYISGLAVRNVAVIPTSADAVSQSYYIIINTNDSISVSYIIAPADGTTLEFAIYYKYKGNI